VSLLTCLGGSKDCQYLSLRKTGGLLLRIQVDDETDWTIEARKIKADEQPSASSFIPPDGCFPSLFLCSLTTKFREYQNGTSLYLNSGSKLTSPESEYSLLLQNSPT
jgi:hypothetical protein